MLILTAATADARLERHRFRITATLTQTTRWQEQQRRVDDRSGCTFISEGAGEQRDDLTTRPSAITTMVVYSDRLSFDPRARLPRLRGPGRWTRTGQLRDSYECPYRAPITHTFRTDGCGTQQAAASVFLGYNRGRGERFRLIGQPDLGPGPFTDPAETSGFPQTCPIPHVFPYIPGTFGDFGPVLFALPRAGVRNEHVRTIVVRRPINTTSAGMDGLAGGPVTAQTTGTVTIRLVRVLAPASQRP
jgi:hypothetical protein